ncbi:MAG: type II secretion system protein GspC [Gammaproteobacteria bacterium]|nr:type II secretion system protein GspC [Gammaproteobacteria bacterium]MBT8111012.1 type II secretion system protein GspC [Gammaproteobacteria bacterium]NNL45710.1 type II secretion system protein GspC [Woeseiaceae bacterium]
MDSSNALSAINRLLPPWVSLLLVVAIAWQIAKIIWMLVPAPAAGVSVPVPDAMPAASIGTTASTDVRAIADSHMFGLADVDAVEAMPTPTADENLSDTRLTNLSLKGTVASDIAEFSVAIISDGNNEEKVYAIGDPIGSSAKLHAVYADRVVLNENGALTNLKLPKEFAASQATTVRRTTRSTRQKAANAQSIQAVVSQNLSKLSDVIRPTPYFVNGQQSGYRVYPGRDRRQFAALGLRPGDLIKDIDGQSLTDPTQAMQIFQALGTSEQVTVTVERNGQPETIVLKTSQLDLDGEQTK